MIYLLYIRVLVKQLKQKKIKMTKLFEEVETGSIMELTHKTGNKYSVKIHRFPKEGDMSIINPKWKLSKDEFAMTEDKFNKALTEGRIKTKQR
jgi:hypothetical protein